MAKEMRVEKKTFDLDFKTFSDDGEFTGYLSTFGNIDHEGDIVERGAFTKTLAETKAFALIWAHDPSMPAKVVGSFHGQEDARGLLIEGNFLPDPDSQNVRIKVRALVERGVKVGLSIGYKTLQFAMDKINREVVRRLKELKLYEGSLALFAMNEEAALREVKALAQEPITVTPEAEPQTISEPEFLHSLDGLKFNSTR